MKGISVPVLVTIPKDQLDWFMAIYNFFLVLNFKLYHAFYNNKKYSYACLNYINLTINHCMQND